MQIKTSFPRAVREIEHTWIPMRDGCASRRALAAGGRRTRPVPAILEYIPYRKRDGTRERDEPIHRWFAGHGYAAVRVDMRGSGDSDGILLDEYLRAGAGGRARGDRWLARSRGARRGRHDRQVVGRLQRAADRRAPAAGAAGDRQRLLDRRPLCGRRPLHGRLRARTTSCRGARRCSPSNARPPDPELVGDALARRCGWSGSSRRRAFVEAWLAHQRRDAYWQHGSVCEDYGAIGCPVYAVGGWADAYPNAIPRLLEGSRARARA